MTAIVSNKIRIAPAEDAAARLRQLVPLLTGADASDTLRKIEANGAVRVPFDPHILKPVPAQILEIPEELPERICLAIAIATPRFDLVRNFLFNRDPFLKVTPDFMRPATGRSVIEENALATLTQEELVAWAQETIPEAVRVGQMMKLALRDTGSMERIGWMHKNIGALSFGDEVRIGAKDGEISISFDSALSAPGAWFETLSEELGERSFGTLSWNEEVDYAASGVVRDNGAFRLTESEDPDVVREVMAAAGVSSAKEEEGPRP